MQNDDHEKQKEKSPQQDELSPVWRELLGGLSAEEDRLASPDVSEIPTLASDPWSSLLHQQGIEIVDLQKNLLQMSDGDVEQMLQRMQERPAREDDTSSSAGK